MYPCQPLVQVQIPSQVYAESEDYFRAGPDYNRPGGIPPSTWTSLKTLIYTVVFMGIPTGFFTWLTAGLEFGDVAGLLAKIKNSIGSKDSQMERINKAFRECTSTFPIEPGRPKSARIIITSLRGFRV